jgi:ribulose-5-phosphate 4-epimerase/fuculose-1-phosphate aldolase
MRRDAAAAEGVIRFALHFTPAGPPEAGLVVDLIRWRQRLVEAGIVGQDPARYGGHGFGNLSRRHPADPGTFLVTGTQTGALPVLDAADFAVVTRVDTDTGHVEAHGTRKPSSEAMTHAALYAACAGAAWVFHAHSPHLFTAHHLDVGRTPPGVDYGTPAMAQAMAALFAQRRRLPDVYVMTAHEDGVIAFGGSAEETGEALLGLLARATGHRGA